ncbi:MAG: phytanoyl-CoA dioxygenase family protein [Terriglobales bacterium]
MSFPFIITVSEAERAQSALHQDTGNAAFAALTNYGFVVLRRAFARDAVEAMHREYMAQFGGYDLNGMTAISKGPSPVAEVGVGRFEIVLRMTGGFDTQVFANYLLLRFLSAVLGEMRLSGFTAVASYPGSEMQRMHRDHAHLFPPYVGPTLPVYAINVSVPLIDVDLTTGPTGIWPGSHRLPDDRQPTADSMVSFPFERGDAILMDYRTVHAGLANRGTTLRPILYMVYARPWFFDDANHPERSPLNMPLAVFNALPDQLKPLLLRAYSQAVRAKLLYEPDAVGKPGT